MNKKFVVLILSFFLLTVYTSAKIINVPGDQPTIQAGINASVKGDTVVVSPGTYFENINLRGKKILLTSRYYEKNDVSFILSTIINGSNPRHPDTTSCVLMINHEDSTTVLQGFTITGGKGTKWRDEHGAGLYREGGGILTAFSSPIIRYNLITKNEAINTSGTTSAGGGGIRCGDSNPKILNNIIINNKGRYGGGIVLNYCNAVVKNNIVMGNTGGEDYGGGGVWMNKNNKQPDIIENNTIINNKSASDGGGILLYNGTNAKLRNNIIFGNTAKQFPQISARNGAAATTAYCDIEGGWSGTGNIDSDPQFSDSSLHLSATSPCTDAGDTSAIFNDNQNPSQPGTALWPSSGGLRNDMGAYGGKGAVVFPNFDFQTSVDTDKGILQKEFKLNQNYPNPFNPSTLISFFLPHEGFITLKVFDILGKEISVLVNAYYKPGTYKVNFNASALPSGIYFYQLTLDGKSSAAKSMLLLK